MTRQFLVGACVQIAPEAHALLPEAHRAPLGVEAHAVTQVTTLLDGTNAPAVWVGERHGTYYGPYPESALSLAARAEKPALFLCPCCRLWGIPAERSYAEIGATEQAWAIA